MIVKIILNYQLKNEVSQANFNNYKRIYNCQPSMKRVYCRQKTNHRKRKSQQGKEKNATPTGTVQQAQVKGGRVGAKEECVEENWEGGRQKKR